MLYIDPVNEVIGTAALLGLLLNVAEVAGYYNVQGFASGFCCLGIKMSRILHQGIAMASV